jgi:hypothetical protein
MQSFRFVVARLLAAAFLAACSFDGALGVDAPRVVCDGFQRIGSSAYLLVEQPRNWEAAKAHCGALPDAHLVTFETVDEVAAVKMGLPLTTSAWSGIYQPRGSPLPRLGWVNQLGSTETAVPEPFPWKDNEPNDSGTPGSPLEQDRENYAELQAAGQFDDAPAGRRSRPLCECTPTL